MGLLEDVKKEIAIQVLNQDDEISNAGGRFSPNELNKYVKLKYAVEEIKDDLILLKKDIALIKAAVLK